MRTSADAAAMSDPEHNRWFRRRWVETSNRPARMPDLASHVTPVLEDGWQELGRGLLADWRAQRKNGGRFE